MLDDSADVLKQAIYAFNEIWPAGSFLAIDFNVKALLAIVVVCFICGAIGSLVVGSRMAFFSDALAHSAFAGVGFGLLIAVLSDTPTELVQQRITLIMVVFGITIGFLIAFVREQTSLTSDTVIGVFFAAAIGLGAIFTKLVSNRGKKYFDIEDFIFGDPLYAEEWEIVLLLALAVGTIAFLAVFFNWLVLSSANPSLALSRRVPVRWSRYLFVVLLALVINLSQRITGTLLINGLLIVPAAAAANLASNLRQMFWYSIAIALTVGISGQWLSWEVSCTFPTYKIGISGTIVVLSVLVFVTSIPLGRLLRRSA